MTVRWWPLAVSLAGLATAVAAPAIARRLDFFRVRRIELTGLRHLPPHRVLAALDLGAEATIYDGLAPHIRQVEAIPGVRSASVTRRLPGTLAVSVAEAVPVALTPDPRGMRVLDARGRVLPFDPARSAPDLPIATKPDPLVARLLGRALAAEPSLFARIGSAWRVGEDVVMEVSGRRLWFRPEASAEEMHAVVAVLDDLARRGRAFDELDGRFAGQVVVRRSRT